MSILKIQQCFMCMSCNLETIVLRPDFLLISSTHFRQQEVSAFSHSFPINPTVVMETSQQHYCHSNHQHSYFSNSDTSGRFSSSFTTNEDFKFQEKKGSFHNQISMGDSIVWTPVIHMHSPLSYLKLGLNLD